MTYEEFVSKFARALEEGRDLPLGGHSAPAHPKLPPGAPKALIFSPHPDDEVIIGGLPLRCLRELQMNVINVAVTQGSNKARQPERWKELSACCNYIGFGLVQLGSGGLDAAHIKAYSEKTAHWAKSVGVIAEVFRQHQPKIILVPHDRDWNSTHIGTHHLVMDALGKLDTNFTCYVVETEFWGAMDKPNLMVESSERDLVDLITALSFHAGEVRRNPYHLRLPAWMIDNVRRGGELVGGQGAAAPDFTFATLYRLRRWVGGRLEEVLTRGEFVSKTDDLRRLFS